jgi:hypothetical protein
MLGGSWNSIKKSTEALVVGSKEIHLEEDTARTKYMLMSLDQDAGRNNIMNTERAEDFQ